CFEASVLRAFQNIRGSKTQQIFPSHFVVLGFHNCTFVTILFDNPCLRWNQQEGGNVPLSGNILISSLLISFQEADSG
ncbi:hypothetical protein AMECASPLE_035776, partial [Ameca splendens]